jgi:hypothetical protein
MRGMGERYMSIRDTGLRSAEHLSFSPGSTSPWPNSPANLEKSGTEKIVAEAKRIVEVRLDHLLF